MMKLHKLSMVASAALICVVATSGCARALRDGVSIGVTDGLSDGIAAIVSNFIASLGGIAG